LLWTKGELNVTSLHWKEAQRRFGIWGVRDYYALLEQMAQEGAAITFGYVLMILAAALLATAGLLINSSAVIIGAMCIAPFLSPSRAVCIGGLFRNRKVFVGGLLKQIFGLLVAGSVTAYVITVLLLDTTSGLEITDEILLRAMPTTQDVVLSVLIAVGAGAAASLSRTADPRIVAKPWGQIIDTMIGVEIAISLMPPAAVIGIGLAFGRPEISRNAFWLLVVNVVGLDFLGSTLMLAIRGVRPRYLALEKTIRRTVESTIASRLAELPVEVAANVILLSDETADVRATIHCGAAGALPASLAHAITAEIETRSGCRSKVVVEMTPCQAYSTLRPEETIPAGTHWTRKNR
jgi:uncharacterized hydrophobic protein (TIGR00271 family)